MKYDNRSAAGLTRRSVLAGTSAAAVGVLFAPAVVGQARLPLRVWSFPSQLQSAIETEFAAANPDIALDYTHFSINELHSQLLVSIATGSGLPDIASISTRRAPEFLASGAFVPTGDMLGDKLGAFGSGGLVTYGQEVYGYQIALGSMAMWMNAEALAGHGVDVSSLQTWDDMLSAAEQLKERTGGAAKMMMRPRGTAGANYFNAFFHSRGGNWWTEDGQVTDDPTLAAEMLAWYADRSARELAMDVDWVQPAHYEALRNGTLLGFAANLPVGLNNIPREAPDQTGQWRMVRWPKWGVDAPVQTGNWGGLFYGATEGANAEAVARFQNWFLEGEGLEAQVANMGVTAYAPARELEVMQRPQEYFGGQQVLLELAQVPLPAFNYFRWVQTEEIIANAVDQVVIGRPVDEVVAQVMAELDRAATR